MGVKKHIENLEKIHTEIKQEEAREKEVIETQEKLQEEKIQQEREQILPERFTVEKSEQIREMVKRAQMNMSRWYLETARVIVVEWLAMKKQDRELNILLAEIYEREKKYQHAAYIYGDLLEEHKDDEVVMQKLWNSLYLLWDNSGAFEIYSQAHKKNRSSTEILDILSHLSLDIKDYKSWVKYANLYLKEKPRNAEKLGIKAYCLEKIGRTRESIEAYKKILDVQPYNSEVQDRISVLEKNTKNEIDERDNS